MLLLPGPGSEVHGLLPHRPPLQDQAYLIWEKAGQANKPFEQNQYHNLTLIDW